VNRILRTIVILLAVLAAAALILVYGFRIRTVAVEGNERYPAEEISSDLMSTSLLQNTLYFAWRYRSAVPSPDAPYLTSVRAKILSPTSVKISVTESTLIGRVQYDGQNVYFDEDGIVQMITDEVRPGIPLVTGVSLQKPTLYQKLSMDNASTLRTMLSVTQLLIQADFIPDSVTFDESGNMTLRFGSVAVRLGQDEYLEEKIANLVQIYPQISSESGTLNMEGFTGKNSSITFRRSSDATDESETEGDMSEILAGAGAGSGDAEEDSGEAAAEESPDDGSQPEAAAEGAGDQSGQNAAEGGEAADDGSQPDGEAGDSGDQEEDQQSVGSGVMAFDSSGTLHYDARIVNGQVVDASGNPIDGCTVDENGNIKDAFWNVIDPVTGQNVQ